MISQEYFFKDALDNLVFYSNFYKKEENILGGSVEMLLEEGRAAPAARPRPSVQPRSEPDASMEPSGSRCRPRTPVPPRRRVRGGWGRGAGVRGSPGCWLVPAPLPLAASPVFGQSCISARPPLGLLAPRLGPPWFPSAKTWTWVSVVVRPALMEPVLVGTCSWLLQQR